MTKPLVSVIVPVYNTEKYLKECLDSVVNQTLKNIEIICVDDGSTDSSANILDQYAANDNRVRVIHKKNTGYGHSMNIGMDAATGEYLAIVESDDYIEPEMLETLYHIAVRENVDIVKADFAHVYGDGDNRFKQVCKLFWDESIYNKVFNPADMKDILKSYVAHWAGIYRKEFIRNHNIKFNVTPGASYQDAGFWFKAFVLASGIYFSDHVFYMYRQDNPNSSVKSKGKIDCICAELQFIYNFLKENPSLYKRFICIYHYYKYGHYMFTYNRIANKLKQDFLRRYQAELLEASRKSELDLEIFNNHEKYVVQMIMSDPDEFYRKDSEFPNYINELVDAFSKVIIYGAGMKGKQVLNALKQSETIDKLVCFAVTDLKNNPPMVEGVIVKEIGDLVEYRESAAVIVAVTDVYRDEMLKTLKYYNFEHPILLRQE